MSVAQQLLTDLGKYIGIDELVFDDNGLCTLAFDDEIVVTIVTVEGSVSAVCFIVEDQDDAHWRKLLEANFAWRETGGANVFAGTGNQTRHVVAQLGIVGIEFPTICQRFGNFPSIIAKPGRAILPIRHRPVPKKSGSASAKSTPKAKSSDKKGPAVGTARYV